MNTIEVIPQEWFNQNYSIKVLFDDGSYSVIFIDYKGAKSLAIRSQNNEESPTGHLVINDNANWLLQTSKNATEIVQTLYSKAVETSNYVYYENILFAINALNIQVAEIDEIEDYGSQYAEVSVK